MQNDGRVGERRLTDEVRPGKLTCNLVVLVPLEIVHHEEDWNGYCGIAEQVHGQPDQPELAPSGNRDTDGVISSEDAGQQDDGAHAEHPNEYPGEETGHRV